MTIRRYHLLPDYTSLYRKGKVCSLAGKTEKKAFPGSALALSLKWPFIHRQFKSLALHVLKLSTKVSNVLFGGRMDKWETNEMLNLPPTTAGSSPDLSISSQSWLFLSCWFKHKASSETIYQQVIFVKTCIHWKGVPTHQLRTTCLDQKYRFSDTWCS